MRYAWFIRVAVVGFTSLLAAANVVPLPPQLQTVVVGLVAIGMLVWAEGDRRASLHDSPMFHAHIKDLQRYAADLANMISGSVYPVDVTIGLGPWFRDHFRQLGQHVDEWNALVEQVNGGDVKVKQVIAAQRSELNLPDNTSYSAVLNSIARGWTSDPSLAQCRVHDEMIVVGVPAPDSASVWQIAPCPADAATAHDLVVRVQQSIQDFSVNPIVATFRDVYLRMPKLSKTLAADLNVTAHIHQPPGHCAGCPR